VVEMNDFDKKTTKGLFEMKSCVILEAISKENSAKDIMPLATSVASWILENLSIHGEIQYSRINEICKAMYVNQKSVLIRIQTNPYIKICNDSLRLKGNTESIKNPIKIPNEQIDTDLNYMERISYIAGVYLHDRTVPFSGEFDDARVSSYLLKVKEDASPEKNICSFSMALFYANEGYREELRPYAIMLLERFTNPNIKNRIQTLINKLSEGG
jgi:hypothetical protein